MACLDMYNQNNDHKNLGHPPPPPPISPRISFSNDFVESSSSSHSHHHHHHHLLHHHQQQQLMRANYRDAPVSSDFEFSVTNYSMMSADELFSQGRLLPLKESSNNNNSQSQKTTLREELMVEDDHDFSLRTPKSSTKWKGFLGLKKSHIGSKKIDSKTDGSSSSSSVEKRSAAANSLHEAKTS